MSTTTKRPVATHRGTCGYCLGMFDLRPDTGHPVRHGWKVYGLTWGHGQQGGNHSSPCVGWRYQHLGLGREALDLAIRDHRDWLARYDAELKRLAKKPELLVFPPKHGWRSGTPEERQRPVTLRDGDHADHAKGHDGYKYEWRNHVYRVESDRKRILQQKVELDKVAARWRKGGSVTIPKITIRRGPATHAPAPYKNRSEYKVPKCKQWAMLLPDRFVLAKPGEEPTCSRCRKALGLAALAEVA